MAMKLLDSNQVKSEKSKSEQKRIERVQKLHEEETSVTKRVNTLREVEKTESKRLDDVVQNKRNEAAIDIAELDIKIGVRRADLAHLLKPIDEQRNAVEKREASASEKEADFLRLETDLYEREQTLSERTETLVDRESEVTERNTALGTRDENLSKSEERHKGSQESLAENWVEYHKTVNETNDSIGMRLKALMQREAEVERARESTVIHREENIKESARLVQERRAIHDTYLALAQAKKHLGV